MAGHHGRFFFFPFGKGRNGGLPRKKSQKIYRSFLLELPSRVRKPYSRGAWHVAIPCGNKPRRQDEAESGLYPFALFSAFFLCHHTMRRIAWQTCRAITPVAPEALRLRVLELPAICVCPRLRFLYAKKKQKYRGLCPRYFCFRKGGI